MEVENPLVLNLGDDPEVVAYLRYMHSRDGVRWAEKQNGNYNPKWGEIPDPPLLSTEQLEEAQKIIDEIDARKKYLIHENIQRYLKDCMWTVCGDYCGGTQFAAGFFKRLGFCSGHESLFSIEGNIAGIYILGAQPEVEVSGAAPLWMPMFPESRTIWLVRHPVDLVNSQYNYKGRRCGTTTDIERDILCRWQQSFFSGPAAVWRLESKADQLHVLTAMGYPPKCWKPGDLERARKAPRNSKKKEGQQKPMTWEKLCEPLRKWAEQIGYTEGGLKE